MRITTADVESYQRTGWFVSDYVLPDEMIAECKEAAERIYRCDYDRVQPWSTLPCMGSFNVPYTHRDHLRVDQFPSFHNDAIRRAVHSKEIAEIAAQLLGSREIRYYKDILIATPTMEAPSSTIGWHIDKSYWPTCDLSQIITVYVPLQTRDDTNGTLIMLGGSQAWTRDVLNMTADYDDLGMIKKKLESAGREITIKPLIHRPGQVSFHSSTVVHATCPNTTDELQYSLVIGLQTEKNTFQPSRLKRLNKSLVINLNDEVGAKLPDGTPDLKNDEFYPVLHREGA